MTRDERQQIGTDKWWNASKYGSHADMWGTLNHITGFGKTYETCKYIIKPFLDLYEAVYKIQHNRDTTVLIITPLTDLVEQWEKTLRDTFCGATVRVTTVQGLIAQGNTNIKCGLLVVDELHYFYGGENAEVFYRYVNGEHIKADYGLGLTATPHYRDGRHKHILSKYPVIDTVTENEARDNGWIPKTNEYNLAVRMTTDEHNEYFENEEKLAKYGAMLGPSPFIAAQKITAGGYSSGQFFTGFQFAMFWAKNSGWTAGCEKHIDEVWNPNKIMGYAKEYMRAVQKRMALLGKVQSKLDAAVEIIVRAGVPAITFSKSTEVADLLTVACKGEGLRAASYHSNIEGTAQVDPETGDLHRIKSGPNKGQPKIFGKDTIKRITLDAMQNGDLDVLNTVDAASAGLDIPRIKLAVLLARGTSDNKQKQRTGRVKRFDPDDLSADMLVVNLFVPNTKDEQYVQQSQRMNKGQVVYRIEDIFTDVPSDELTL